MSVFIIDEERHFAENVASALRFEGKDAKVFPDATEALAFFVSQRNGLSPANMTLLVDVSLAPGDDLETFSHEATDDFLQTGIVLVEQLLAKCPGLCLPTNTVLYTAHYRTALWNRIENFCTKHGFGSWRKAPDSSVDDVVALVESRGSPK